MPSRRSFLAPLLSLFLLLPACSDEGDTIVNEVVTESPPASGTLLLMTPANILVNVSPSAPTTIISATPIQGLATDETFVAIDYRPSDKRLYGWSSDSRLYRIDPLTGVALPIGALPVFISGGSFGFDFNPVADRGRIVTDLDFNVRINPDDVTFNNDTAVAYAPGDVNVGDNPLITALAYTNNVAGAATTTLYGIDQLKSILVTVNPPNNGTLNTVGPLGVTTYAGTMCFDIAPSGTAYAAIYSAFTIVQLHTIDLSTGTATLVGTLGTGSALVGMSVVP